MTDTIRMLALSGLAYEDEAPLGMKVLNTLPAGNELSRLNMDNTQLLLADASLEERHSLEPKEDQPLYQEIHRLEFKVDAMMRLLAELLEQQRALPAARKFRMHAQGLEWMESTAAPLTVGAKGVVSVYINRALPYPIRLPSEVTAVSPADGESVIRVEFRGLSTQVGELLEKLIFRHHRRQIAEARAVRN